MYLSSLDDIGSVREKLRTLASLLQKMVFPEERHGEEGAREGDNKVTTLQQLITHTMIQWAQQPIHSPELTLQIFALLYRQFDEINEVVRRDQFNTH